MSQKATQMTAQRENLKNPDLNAAASSAATLEIPFIAKLAFWVLVLCLIWLSITGLNPPPPAPATTPAQEFSAERALEHVRAIAQQPHPIGSVANVRVRQYLIEQLSRLNANPEAFFGLGVSTRGGNVAAGYTQDVLARIPGTANSRAILLVAHYDSVYRGAGAADDGASVAAILETLRAIQAGPKLKNDILILLTDGEEVGLLGAQAFAASSHPWIKNTGLIMNFEARGNRGPSLLFETSPGNELLMKEVAYTAAGPVSSSFFYTLYKTLPNDTDFTAFRSTKIPGLNFAFGGGLEIYHSRLDTPENLSAASLQHQGSCALALLKDFGQKDLTAFQQHGQDAVFFNWFGKGLIVYAQRWVLPQEMALTILLVLSVILIRKSVVFRFHRVGLGVLLWLVLIAVTASVVGGIEWIVSRVLGGRMLVGDTPANSLLLIGLVLFAGAAASFLWLIFVRKLSAWEWFASALLLLWALNWAVAVALPSASYFLLWPLFLGAAVFLAIRLINGNAEKAARSYSALIGGIAAALLLAPLVDLLYVYLPLQIVALAAAVVVGLIVVFSHPFMFLGRRSSVVLLLCALVCIGSGYALSHPSKVHPRRDTLVYSVNADNQSAEWISFDAAPDKWTAQFLSGSSRKRQPLPDFLAGDPRSVYAAPAPVQAFPAPVAETVSVDRDGGQLRIHLRVRSVRGADVLTISFPEGIKGTAARIGDKDVIIRQTSGRLTLNLYAMGDKQVDVSISVADAPSAVSFWVMDQSYGLPAGTAARPDDLTASFGSDLSLMCRKYTL